MTVVTRPAVTPTVLDLPQTESQRSTKTPATTAVDLVREFPRKRKGPGRTLQGLSLSMAQGKVQGR